MITVPLSSARNVVLEDDEAIDREHADYDWAQFKRTGDLKHCPCKPGGQLTTFRIEPLSARAYEQVMNLRDKPTSMAWEAVSLGLVSSEHYKVGTPPMDAVWKRTPVSGMERLTEECFKRNFRPAVYYELSGRIMEISSLDP